MEQVLHPTFFRGGSLSPAGHGPIEKQQSRTLCPTRSALPTVLSLQSQVGAPSPDSTPQSTLYPLLEKCSGANSRWRRCPQRAAGPTLCCANPTAPPRSSHRREGHRGWDRNPPAHAQPGWRKDEGVAETSGPADAELPRIWPGLVAHADPGVKAPQPPRASAQLGCSWRPGTWPDLYLRALLERRRAQQHGQ